MIFLSDQALRPSRRWASKDRAKALMEKAGVPVTPGYHGDNQDPAYLKEQADGIGYPVLIKAVAGGGGKGMRKVDRAADFAAALDSCKREAASSFGDETVLIEKIHHQSAPYRGAGVRRLPWPGDPSLRA